MAEQSDYERGAADFKRRAVEFLRSAAKNEREHPLPSLSEMESLIRAAGLSDGAYYISQLSTEPE